VELADQNPSERREDAPGAAGPITPDGVVRSYIVVSEERSGHLEKVDAFVDTYMSVLRDVAEEFVRVVPARIPVESSYHCTRERTRCVFALRIDHLQFSFLHLREVAYFSSAPVPEEIAGQVALYVQEVPVTSGAPLSDGNLISSMFIYPLRREWRFMWGHSAGRLYTFDDTAQLREKVLRDIRSVLVGSTGFRRWPELEQVARIPAAFLEVEKEEGPTIGFLKPSLKVQRGGALGSERASAQPGTKEDGAR
jgi:hypothetical protein